MNFAVLSAVSAFLTPSAPVAAPIVIINARIEVSPGVVIPSGGIRVKDGKIEAVGTDVTATSGYETIDVKGAWAFPGFIEGYTRDGLKLPETPKPPAYPDTQKDALYSMFHGNRRGIYPTLDASKVFDVKSTDARYLSQGFTTIHTASGRGAFGGQSAVFNLSSDGLLLRGSVTETVSFNVPGGDSYPTSPMGNFAVVRQFLSDGKTAASQPSTDPDELALASAFKAKEPLLVAAVTERQIDRAIIINDEFGLPTILLGGRDAAVRAADIKAKGIEVLLDLTIPDEPKRTQSTDAEQKLSDPPVGYLEDRYQRWVDSTKYAARANAAGIPFGFYADSAKGKVLELLRQHITLGLSREAALAAVTTNVARILGVADKVGTIAPGKVANIAIFPGDFTVAGSKPTLVIAAGEKKEFKS